MFNVKQAAEMVKLCEAEKKDLKLLKSKKDMKYIFNNLSTTKYVSGSYVSEMFSYIKTGDDTRLRKVLIERYESELKSSIERIKGYSNDMKAIENFLNQVKEEGLLLPKE